MKTVWISALATAALFLSSWPCSAQVVETEPEKASKEQSVGEDWEFEVSPYLWYNQIIDSDITFRNSYITRTKLRVRDQNEDYKLSYGARLYASDGKWGFFVDLNAAPSTFFYQGAGTYRLINKGDSGYLDGYFGFRAYSIDFEVEASRVGRQGGLPNQGRIDENLGFAAPIVGAKGEFAITDNLNFYGQGDIGGFGIMGSDLTYRLDGGFDFEVSDSASIRLGWSQIRMDNEDVSDLGRVKYEATFGGPTLGARFEL